MYPGPLTGLGVVCFALLCFSVDAVAHTADAFSFQLSLVKQFHGVCTSSSVYLEQTCFEGEIFKNFEETAWLWS